MISFSFNYFCYSSLIPNPKQLFPKIFWPSKQHKVGCVVCFSYNFEILTTVKEIDDVCSYYKISRHLYCSSLPYKDRNGTTYQPVTLQRIPQVALKISWNK